MVEFISPSTTPWETKAGSELGGRRNNWSLCPAQPNMGQDIRVQKSPSVISRGREACKQCLQREKSPFPHPHISVQAGASPLSYFWQQAQLQHRLGDAHGFVCQATTAPPTSELGLIPVKHLQKQQHYIPQVQEASWRFRWHLSTLLSKGNPSPNSQETHRMKNLSFCSTWSIKPKYSSNSFVNKYRAPWQCRWFIGT